MLSDQGKQADETQDTVTRDGAGPYGNASQSNPTDVEAQFGRLLVMLADPSATEGLSLARVSKRCALPMSTLRRILTGLEEAGVVTVLLSDDGRGRVKLTDLGEGLAASLLKV